MFELKEPDSNSNARIGLLKLNSIKIETPFFMPVETKGTAKFLTQETLNSTKTQCIIVNAFLSYLKPGIDIISEANGLHKFIKWNKGIFTDSGGFQMINPDMIQKTSSKGAYFKSPFDGSKHFITPERLIEIQNTLSSDVAMVLDEMPTYGSTYERVKSATIRTSKWAKKCLDSHKNEKQLLFGIIQGGIFPDLREKNAKEISSLNFDGIALGGLAVGEPMNIMHKIVEKTVPFIPKEKIRYLMGLGSPIDILKSIQNGIDCFDSCFPTRMARHGVLFTSKGKLLINKNIHKKSFEPIDNECACFVCKKYSKSYLHHLYKAKEPTVKIYLSYHNIYFIQHLIEKAKERIKDGTFNEFVSEQEKKLN